MLKVLAHDVPNAQELHEESSATGRRFSLHRPQVHQTRSRIFHLETTTCHSGIQHALDDTSASEELKMSQTKRFLKSCIGAAILTVTAVGGAQAATVGYCNDGGAGLSPLFSGYAIGTADFQYRGADADNCYGVVAGNDSAADLNNVGSSGMFGIDTWSQLSRFNAPSSTTPGTFTITGIGTIAFSLNYLGLNAMTGYHGYELVANDNPDSILPGFFDLVGVIKQGSGPSGPRDTNPLDDGGWAAYFFDNAFVGDSGNFGRFETVFGPGSNGFSHFTFYGANYEACSSRDPRCEIPPDQDVPEPGTLALVGVALLGLARSRFRKA